MCIQTYVVPWFIPFAPSLRSFALNTKLVFVGWEKDDNENIYAILFTTIQSNTNKILWTNNEQEQKK